MPGSPNCPAGIVQTRTITAGEWPMADVTWLAILGGLFLLTLALVRLAERG
ncbi:hypothetical protein ACNI3Q_10965 [Sphingomonas sp. FW199]|uniref:hypothetical protein n=1 Tax=Sphingomonas sp. FW199 TaxID=3400217 RepID=UPI003CFA3CBD